MNKINVHIDFVGRFKNSIRGRYSDLHHSMLADSVEEAKAEIMKTFEVVKWGKIQQEEVRPPMVSEEYFSKAEELLARIPKEFRFALSYRAYEQGHACGYEECFSILSDLVNELEKPIKDFEDRVRSEALATGSANLAMGAANPVFHTKIRFEKKR